jgi:hypothetical protein
MIDESPFKIIQRDLRGLYNYIYMTTSQYSTLHSVITFFRFTQFCGPALIAACQRFWVRGNVTFMTMSVFSVFFHIIPPGSRNDTAQPTALISFTVQAAVIALSVAVARY